jgi:23S rRNA (cytidine1920-2'-O)/16S rRNA (cytidine1409-2'-O)-methyltransferase
MNSAIFCPTLFKGSSSIFNEMMRKERFDKLLVEKGMVKRRERARALIMAGKVTVEGKMIDKPGTNVDVEAKLQIREEDSSYVSRGGEKLEGALTSFGIDPKGMVVMDIGASTGGFTDCILQKGAQKVYAVDVGYGQLAWKLQKDPRVVDLERRNIRYLKREEVEEEADLILIDTSFISIEKFLLHLLGFLKRGGFILSLIKPQFEAGKKLVKKGGVVRDSRVHEAVTKTIQEYSTTTLGLTLLGVIESPLLGPAGNKEFLIALRKP